MSELRKSHLTITAALLLSCAAPSMAIAQVADRGAAAPAVQPTGGIEDIVVTAQRRSESAQRVPVAISAISGVNLAARGVDTIRDLQNVDPGLNITNYSGSVIPFLRGIGNPSSNTIGNESSVPIYIDEVYYSRISPVYLELNNVDRVEVLKGPQGTLFGRNSSGGLIHVITRDPNLEAIEGQVRAGFGNYQTVTGKLYLSTPIANGVAADLSVSGLHQGDGWGVNRFTGNDVYKQKFINVRSKLLLQPAEGTSIRLTGLYSRLRSSQFNNVDRYRGSVGGTPLFYGPAQPLPSLAGDDGFYDGNNNRDGYDTFESYGGSLKINQELGFADAVSITSYRWANETYYVDGDLSFRNYLNYDIPSVDRQFTQELQLKSNPGSRVSWIVGAFYLKTKQGYTPIRITGDLFPSLGLEAQELYGLQKVNSLSGFGQVTVPLGDITNATAGVRYTSDKVRGIGSTSFDPLSSAPPALGGPIYNKAFRFKKLTYKFALDHRLTPDIMAYASVGRGYKAGTFNTIGLGTDPSRPETIDAYELGLKSDLFDRQVRLNVALFWNDISNPQVQSIVRDAFSGANFVGLTNADKARARGVEAELQARVSSALQLRLAGAYTDAKYLDFQNAPYNFPVADASGRPVAPYGLTPIVFGNADGNRLPGASKWRFNAGANYSLDTGFGKIVYDVNVAYTGKFAWEADNLVFQRRTWIVNGTVSMQPTALDNLDVRLWAKNLTNVKYYSAEVANPGQSGNASVAAAPRTYGIEIGYKF